MIFHCAAHAYIKSKTDKDHLIWDIKVSAAGTSKAVLKFSNKDFWIVYMLVYTG